MKIIDKIKGQIEFMKFYKPKCIVLHPETERKIFTEEELSKSESLEGHFGLPVILSKEIKINEIVVGV